MKEVKIFSESSHSDLENALNNYLRSLHHSDVVKCITYNFPNKAGEVWSAVVEIDYFGGKPVFWASNNAELNQAIEMYGNGVKPPFVVRIPDHATTVKDSAFKDNENIGIVLLPDSLTRIEQNAFQGCCNLFDIDIPSSVTHIGDSAFSGCRNLFRIDIPSSVTHIGDGAFDNCDSLNKLFIPSSVTEIGGRIANVVSTIEVDTANQVYDSRNNCNAIIETATNTLINGSHNTKIPDSVTKIAAYAFNRCSFSMFFNIPDTVCEIEYYAFNFCKFYFIRIPKSLKIIESGVFSDCYISTIYIPNSVTNISSDAFGYPYTIQETHIEILDPNKVQFGDNNDCFEHDNGDRKQRKLYVPKGTKNLYERHPAFEGFDEIVEDKK